MFLGIEKFTVSFIKSKNVDAVEILPMLTLKKTLDQIRINISKGDDSNSRKCGKL